MVDERPFPLLKLGDMIQKAPKTAAKMFSGAEEVSDEACTEHS